MTHFEDNAISSNKLTLTAASALRCRSSAIIVDVKSFLRREPKLPPSGPRAPYWLPIFSELN